MPISIRDREVEVMARELARQRNTTMTDVIRQALKKEILTTPRAKANRAAIREIQEALKAASRPGGRTMTKAEIDAMWGHE